MLSACGKSETAQSHIVQAEALLADNQYKSAIISLKNAIKIEAKNAHARFVLGRLYLSLGNAQGAEKELLHAYELKYERVNLLPLLARAYMLTESDDNILSLEEEAKLLPEHAQTQYLAYKTMAALRLEQEALAKESVDAAQLISDTSAYSVLASAYFEFAKKNTTRARTLVERILVAMPENTDALMLQGQIASAENDFQQAVDSFKQYYALQPESGKVQLFIADSLLKVGQYSEAESIADAVLAVVPNQPFVQYIKAMARFEDKDYKAASQYANASLSSGFSSFSLKLVAGASAFYLQNYEQCHLHLNDLIAYLPVEHSARRMLAVSQLQLGLIDDISETLSGYDPSIKENSQFLSMLSYELLEVGAIDKAKQMMQQVSDSENTSAEQSMRAGILKLMMNDPSGVENLELALQSNPELVSAELALAFASVKLGDLARANEIAQKWQKKYPKKAGSYNLQATIAFKENNIEQGRAALEKSLQLEPDNVYALTESVKLAFHEKAFDKAKALTERALEVHPKEVKILRQYFEFHQDDVGLAVLQETQQSDKENIAYGILLAEALIKLEKFKKASDLLAEYKLNAKTPKHYWQLVFFANLKQKDGVDTFTILDKWRKNSPYHIEPVLLLVDYWTKKRVPDRALNVINRSLKQHPKYLMLHVLKMQLLLNNNRVNDAKVLLTKLAQLNLNENLMAGIEGRILLLEKKYAEAIPKLTQQYKAKPVSKNAMFLAVALEGNNQQQAGIKLLEEFALLNTDLGNTRLTLANMYIENTPNKAIDEYELILQTQPNNIVALNNLSWLYMEQGKYKVALKHAEHVYGLAEKVPNVVDTYAQILLKSKQSAKALVKAEEAYTLSKAKNVDIALNYGEILLANDKKIIAKNVLNKIEVKTAEQKDRLQMLMKKL